MVVVEVVVETGKDLIITDILKLKNICSPIEENEVSNTISLLEQEIEILTKRGIIGIGLAAPQIDITKRVAIIRIEKIKINLVNCDITDKFDPIVYTEGCISLPGQTCKVKRYNQIIIKNNKLGFPDKFMAYGLPAIAIQHELDHLDGILITDKAILKHNNIGLNQPCPCGSGKKYKKCCKGKNNGH